MLATLPAVIAVASLGGFVLVLRHLRGKDLDLCFKRSDCVALHLGCLGSSSCLMVFSSFGLSALVGSISNADRAARIFRRSIRVALPPPPANFQEP